MEYVDTLHYRGLSIPVCEAEGRYAAVIAGKTCFVCADSEAWEPALKAIVDRSLGEIRRISQDAWVGWFENGGHEDVGLFLRGRLLKVWLAGSAPSESDLRAIEDEARLILAEIAEISPGRSAKLSETEIRWISEDPNGGSD